MGLRSLSVRSNILAYSYAKKIMKKKTIITMLLAMAAFSVKAQGCADIIDSSIYKIEKLPKFVFNNSVSFQTTGSRLTKLVSVRPIAISNMYQYNSGTFNLDNGLQYRFIADADTTNGFIMQTTTDERTLELISMGGHIYSDVCVMQPYKLTVDFKKIKKIYPYDINSALYKQYTSEQLPDIAINNADAMAAADYFWKKSKGDVLKYARMCYEEVAQKLTWSDDFDMLPYEEVLRKGGGNCGSFTSVYVTLLRIKGIPARHVFALLQNRNYHIWAEFYLERYGWIPVDPTWKNGALKKGDMKSDYFGYYDGSAIIVSRGMYIPFYLDDGSRHAQRCMQHGWYNAWWNGPKPEVHDAYGHTTWPLE